MPFFTAQPQNRKSIGPSVLEYNISLATDVSPPPPNPNFSLSDLFRAGARFPFSTPGKGSSDFQRNISS